MGSLKVGDKAPDFCLTSTSGGEVKLSDLLKDNKYVIVAFYPAAFTSVCGNEMSLYQEVQSEFKNMGAQIIGISEDNLPSIKAWCQEKGIGFPMLSDFHPKGAVAQEFGVLREQDGMAERALFIVDSDMVIRYAYISSISQNPGADRLFDELEKLNSGQDKVVGGKAA